MRTHPTPIRETPGVLAGGPARSRLVTWQDPAVIVAAARGRSGLDTLRAIRDGVVPLPPMARLLQMELVGLAEGRVEVTGLVDESVSNPFGVVHGGLVSALLDTVAGWAVQTTLPEGSGITSIELTVNFLRPVYVSSGPLTAVGAVVRPGRRVAFAEGQVRNAIGRVVATATSSLLVIPLQPEAGAPAVRPDAMSEEGIR
ncbi:MAG: thioesterase superfamily protein [Blastococcus sp.]|jgi:uncharacterized protein (TIGR00369 family)|nr:thioesterase superfamily protein [Blastococcus sp.]